MIQRAATYVLASLEQSDMDAANEPKPDKKLLRRMSYTQCVPKDVFDQHNNKNELKDDRSLIIVHEPDDELHHE